MRKFICFSFIAMSMMINANVVTALASPILPSQDFFIEQNIDMQKVVEQLEDEENYIIDEKTDEDEDVNENEDANKDKNINEDKDTNEDEIDINDLKLVQLIKWFDSIEKPTFSEFKAISVEGDEGVEIFIVVYHEEEVVVVTKSYSQTIGASGMYKEDVSLDYIGKNYVLIITRLDGDIYSRQFIVNRKTDSTKQELKTKYVDLYKGKNVGDANEQKNELEKIKEEIKEETNEEIKEDMTNISTEIQDSIKGINEFSWVR